MVLKEEEDMPDEIREKVRTLNTQSQKLKIIQHNMRERDALLFKLCVDAVKSHDEERAKIYADELSRIRGIRNFLNNNIILMECMTIRLETYVEFRSFVTDLKPIVEVVRNASKMLTEFMPQVSNEIQVMSSNLNEVLLTTTIDISKVSTFITSATPESESILKEVSSLLGEKAESSLPEPPILIVEAPEKLALKENEAIAIANTDGSSHAEDLLSSKLSESDFFDEILFDYLKEHGGKINIVQCSNDLNLSYDEIKKRLSKLKNLGKIKIEE